MVLLTSNCSVSSTHVTLHLESKFIRIITELYMQPQSIQETDLFTDVQGKKIYIKTFMKAHQLCHTWIMILNPIY